MKYLYQGPVDSSVTLKIGGKEEDVMLFRGKEVELPEDHEYTKTLLALKHLAPAKKAAPAKPKTEKGAE